MTADEGRAWTGAAQTHRSMCIHHAGSRTEGREQAEAGEHIRHECGSSGSRSRRRDTMRHCVML